jgi:hypothetical protein
LECLEGRELLAYTPLGFSLPDLTVSGYAAPAASWNGTLAVTVTVQNLGASTINEPLSLAPGSTSTADAQATQVEVYLSKKKGPNARPVGIGTITIPSVAQNSDTTVSQTLAMPAQFPGFPGDGGTVYVSFAVDPFHTIPESDYTNNASGPKPLLIAAPFPELVAEGLDVPPVMQPGDTINPNISIDNLGPADTAAQGPVTVDLIASTTPTFNRGSTVIASYTIANIPGIANVPQQTPAIAPITSLAGAANIAIITGTPVTLPVLPKKYFIGIVIDPNQTIKQLHKIGGVKGVGANFSLSHKVGPPIVNLPAAGVLTAGGPANIPTFPNPL